MKPEETLSHTPTSNEAEQSNPAEIQNVDGKLTLNRLPTEVLSVRRLTPTECELLQGFPKEWTVPDTKHWGTPSRRRLSSGLPRVSKPVQKTDSSAPQESWIEELLGE